MYICLYVDLCGCYYTCNQFIRTLLESQSYSCDSISPLYLFMNI